MKRCRGPTQKRAETQMQRILDQVPKDIWLIIFTCLVPDSNDFYATRSINNLYNCRLVCKKWAGITRAEKLWAPIIELFAHRIGPLWPDLTYAFEYQCKTFVSPPSLFAQITLRGMKPESATIKLLAKWFKLGRWRLLFQALAPILDLSYFYFQPDVNLEPFRHGPDLHNSNHYIWHYTRLWGALECGVSRAHGDCFWIRAKTVSPIVVLHCDERGDFVEIRRPVNDQRSYESQVVEPRHIWYGIQCMQELWKGGKYFEDHPSGAGVMAVWRRCMNIGPIISPL